MNRKKVSIFCVLSVAILIQLFICQVVWADTNKELYKSTNLNLYNNTNKDIYKSSNLDIYKSPQSGIYKNANQALYNNPQIDLYKSSNLDLYKNPNTDLYKSIKKNIVDDPENSSNDIFADTTLKSISSNGELIKDFSPSLTAYFIYLSENTKNPPQIEAIALDPKAKVETEQAASKTGNATILVTSANGKHKTKYFVYFKFKAAQNLSLSSISLSQGILSPAFSPDILEYKVELPLFSKNIPQIKAISQSDNVNVTVTDPKGLPGEAVITVVGNGDEKKTYKISYTVKSLIPLEKKPLLLVSAGILFIALIVLVILLVKIRTKSNKRRRDKGTGQVSL